MHKLEKILRKELNYIDVIHSHDLHSTAIGCLLKKKYKVPLVSSWHFLLKQPYSKKILFDRYSDVEKFALKNSDEIICLSQYQKKLLEIEYGIYNTNIIPNSVDFKFWNKKSKQDLGKLEIINKINFYKKDNYKIITFVGRVEKEKGIHYINQVAQLIEGKKIIFLVAGEGSLKEKKSDNIKHIEYIGFLDKKVLRYLYKKSDALFLPTFFENCNTVVLEAMAAGAIVLTTDVGGNIDIIKNDKNGFLLFTPKSGIEKINMQSIKDKLNYILELDNQEKKRITCNANNTVYVKYDYPVIGKKIYNLYKTMMNNSN